MEVVGGMELERGGQVIVRGAGEKEGNESIYGVGDVDYGISKTGKGTEGGDHKKDRMG